MALHRIQAEIDALAEIPILEEQVDLVDVPPQETPSRMFALAVDESAAAPVIEDEVGDGKVDVLEDARQDDQRDAWLKAVVEGLDDHVVGWHEVAYVFAGACLQSENLPDVEPLVRGGRKKRLVVDGPH